MYRSGLTRAAEHVTRKAASAWPEPAAVQLGAWTLRAAALHNRPSPDGGTPSAEFGSLTLTHHGTDVLTVDRWIQPERPDGPYVQRAWTVALHSGAYSASDRDGINAVLGVLAVPVRVTAVGTGGRPGRPGALYLYANRPGVEFSRVQNADPDRPTYARDARDPGPMSAAWTPKAGWHDVTEPERQRMQAEAVTRLTGRRP